jgi:hypothetical protein
VPKSLAYFTASLFFGGVIGVGWTASFPFRRVSIRETFGLVFYWAMLAFLLTVFEKLILGFSG